MKILKLNNCKIFHLDLIISFLMISLKRINQKYKIIILTMQFKMKLNFQMVKIKIIIIIIIIKILYNNFKLIIYKISRLPRKNRFLMIFQALKKILIILPKNNC